MSYRLHIIIVLLLLACASFAISLCKGAFASSLYQILFSKHSDIATIFFQIRLPRTLAAFTCGGLLALAGLMMQLLLTNPLADPYILGVSSGASLLSLICLSLGLNATITHLGAWGGSLLTMAIICASARLHHWRPQTLLLLGVSMSSLFAAAINVILLLMPGHTAKSIYYWLSGDLSAADWPTLQIGLLLISLLIIVRNAPSLDLLARGDEVAKSLGIHTRQYYIGLFLLASVLTSAAFTLAGNIGFIGLIIPHMMRRLTKQHFGYLAISSVLAGGTLLTLADVGSRTLFSPIQIPVGIVMTVIGVPFFIGLIARGR